MQMIDVPATARITRAVPSGPDPTQGQSATEAPEYVLMTRDHFDSLCLRLLLAEAG